MKPGEVPNKVCSRCSGAGVLPQFNHVANGICFRCWGSGVDPLTINDLKNWLARARKGYKARRDALPKADSKDQPRLARDLAIIANLGKKNRARLETLESERVMGRAAARQKG